MQCIGEKEREHKRSRDGGQGGHVHKVADRSVGTASLRSKTTKSDGVGEETEVSLESHTTPRFHVLNAMEMAAVSTYIDVDDGQTDGEVERNGELLMAHCRLFAAATLMQLMAPVGEREESRSIDSQPLNPLNRAAGQWSSRRETMVRIKLSPPCHHCTRT